MPFLTKYKPAVVPVIVKSTRTGVSIEQKRRNKLIASISDQISIAEAAIKGQVFTPKDKNGKPKISKSGRPAVVRQWWETDTDGAIWVKIKYGPKALAFGGNKEGFKQTSVKDLPVFFTEAKDAVAIGEFDTHIKTAAAGIGKRFGGKKK